MSRKAKDIHKPQGYNLWKPVSRQLRPSSGPGLKTEIGKFTHPRGKHVSIVQGILALPFDFYEYPPFIEFLKSNASSYMNRMSTKRELIWGLQYLKDEYPDHLAKAKECKDMHLKSEGEKAAKKSKGKEKEKEKVKAVAKPKPGNKDQSGGEEGSGLELSDDEAEDDGKSVSSRVFVEDLIDFWFGWPLQHPNPTQHNYRKVTSGRRGGVRAGSDTLSDATPPPSKTAPPKTIASKKAAPPKKAKSAGPSSASVDPLTAPIDSNEDEDIALQQTIISSAGPVTQIPTAPLYGLWKTKCLPPHILNWLASALTVFNFAFASAVMQRAFERGELVTHSSPSGRGRFDSDVSPRGPTSLTRRMIRRRPRL